MIRDGTKRKGKGILRGHVISLGLSILINSHMAIQCNNIMVVDLNRMKPRIKSTCKVFRVQDNSKGNNLIHCRDKKEQILWHLFKLIIGFIWT